MNYDLVRRTAMQSSSVDSERSSSGRGLVIQAGPFDYQASTVSGRGVTGAALIICRNADRPGDRSYDISLPDFLKIIFG